MATRFSVLLAQVNFRYGDNVFVPYSVGMLQAYAEKWPEIREHFSFQPPLFWRQDPIELLKTIEEPAIVCFSSYLWNWQYNIALAKAIRLAFPKCLIVFGGTQVPNASAGFFVEHPYIDLLVHQEGELVFTEILREFLSPKPDYTKVLGLSVQIENRQTLKTPPSPRIKDLSQLVSPYLSGVFNSMLNRGFVLNASQETNRGCPYACTFCDWGGSTFDKITQMDEATILAELEWFGQNKAEFIFNCDANFGILPRDLDLVEKMVKIKEKYGGYPGKFRMCTAKKSNNNIFEICRLLNKAGMSKGATLSFQSMDPHTLDVVKRHNIGISVFSQLMKQYEEAKIPTYTEMIIGMPGETYQSTKDGLDALLTDQPKNINLFAYVCSALPNSEMSEPAYVAEHRIETVRMPILLAHSTPEPESFTEYQQVVAQTATMSSDDWQRAYLLYWTVQTFHCLGLAQWVAIFFNKIFDLSYSDFYEQLFEYFASRPETLLGQEIELTKEVVGESLNGGRLDRVLPDCGNIYWPLDESTFLQLIVGKERFYSELGPFLETLIAESNKESFEAVVDLVRYQAAVVSGPADIDRMVGFKYDWLEYFSNQSGSNLPLPLPVNMKIDVKRRFDGDLEAYAREVVWYGRKGGRPYHNMTVVLPV